MKNNFLFITLIVLLTGCASTNTKINQINNAPLVKAGLITPTLAKYMVSEDTDKIQQLIDTSQPRDKQSWKNKVTHNIYQFNSLRVFINAKGQPCRTYQIKALISGRIQQLQANVCRQSDGSWQANNSLNDS